LRGEKSNHRVTRGTRATMKSGRCMFPFSLCLCGEQSRLEDRQF
jgi:DTW domain-containing protein YfiP